MPLMFAGQLSVQRPQTAHAKPSSSSFQVKSCTLAAPKLSAVSRSRGVERVPLGSSGRVRKLMGAATMCMCFDSGMNRENPRITPRCSHQERPCRPPAKSWPTPASAKRPPRAEPTRADAWTSSAPDAVWNASVRRVSAIREVISSRITADSFFCVRSKVSRCGRTSHRRTAAQASTAKKVTARMSR